MLLSIVVVAKGSSPSETAGGVLRSLKPRVLPAASSSSSCCRRIRLATTLMVVSKGTSSRETGRFVLILRKAHVEAVCRVQRMLLMLVVMLTLTLVVLVVVWKRVHGKSVLRRCNGTAGTAGGPWRRGRGGSQSGCVWE